MFSLILPFHSDFGNILASLDLIEPVRSIYEISEVLLCHNGSHLNNKTAKELKNKTWPGVKLFHTDHAGIGAGLKLGIQNAAQDYVVLSGSDLPFGFSDIESFMKIKEQRGFCPAFAIGSKAHRDSDIAGYGLKRRLASVTFYLLRAVFLGSDTPKDSQGSLIIKTSLAKELIKKSRCENYTISLELATIYLKSGGTVEELPVVLTNHKGESSVSLIRDGIKMASDVIHLSRRSF